MPRMDDDWEFIVAGLVQRLVKQETYGMGERYRERLEQLDHLIARAESLVNLLAEGTGVPVGIDVSVQQYMDRMVDQHTRTLMQHVYDRIDAAISNTLYLQEETGNGTDSTT